MLMDHISGWVATDMGLSVEKLIATLSSEAHPITPEESASGIVKVITTAKLEDSGAFSSYDGTRVPW